MSTKTSLNLTLNVVKSSLQLEHFRAVGVWVVVIVVWRVMLQLLVELFHLLMNVRGLLEIVVDVLYVCVVATLVEIAAPPINVIIVMDDTIRAFA